MANGFANGEVSRIIVIQSLEDHEVPTGQVLFKALEAVSRDERSPIGGELHRVDSSAEFSELVEHLIQRASTQGLVPALHIECHGDADHGLEFANGSELPWPELGALLVRLNLACRFNLVLSLSACYGAHFLQQPYVFEPSPCWFLIAPTHPIDPSQAMHVFREFYTRLIRTWNLDEGIAPIDSWKGKASGEWYYIGAEHWYQHIVVTYMGSKCTIEENKVRALNIWKSLGGKAQRLDKKHFKMIIAAMDRGAILEKGFNTFFAVDQVPANSIRFAPARMRLEKLVDEYARSGKFALRRIPSDWAGNADVQRAMMFLVQQA